MNPLRYLHRRFPSHRLASLMFVAMAIAIIVALAMPARALRMKPTGRALSRSTKHSASLCLPPLLN